VAADVRNEFLRTWNAYRRRAWGHDELRPVSDGHHEFFAPGHPVGLTIVEWLDTLYLMELDDELDRALDWVDRSLDFDIDADFQVFEAIIRMIGGLLSGYHATRERMLLRHARDLADRLLPAFEESPTGAPWRYVNLRTGAVRGRENYLAEIGTNMSEFGELSRLTHDPHYYRAAKKAFAAVLRRRSALDLVGTSMDVVSGKWIDTTASNSPPVDSFYEYLWDGWVLFDDPDLLRWYRLLTRATIAHLMERTRDGSGSGGWTTAPAAWWTGTSPSWPPSTPGCWPKVATAGSVPPTSTRGPGCSTPGSCCRRPWTTAR
jgi:hypothetical protein